MVKKSNLPQSLILLSGLAGIGFLFIQNRKALSEGVGNLLTRKPTPQNGEPTPESPLARAPLPAKDISLIGMDALRRKTPRFIPPPPAEKVKRQPTRTAELSSVTGKVDTGSRRQRQLRENVRRPTFLSKEEQVSERATRRKFGLTRRPTTKEGRKRIGRVSTQRLFEEQERARKVFDARSIVNF